MVIRKTILKQSFYDREVTEVARDLIGRYLVRKSHGKILAGIIIETEAYRGQEDLACHACVGKTKRNAIMYGPPGYAYIYFTYGMHWMLNCVCCPEYFPAAVLIRSIWPTDGLQIIASHRNQQNPKDWCNGPAKICQALDLDGKLNGIPLFQQNSELRIGQGVPISPNTIQTSPRIGLGSTPEPWLSKPWRYFIPNEQLQKIG
jgi:DNA-3-methyladenine glycosylase